MKWNIVTDSSCDLKHLNDQQEKDRDIEVSYTSVPFIISVADREFVDDDHLDVNEMLDVMESSREASRTSCPAPQAWYDAFMQEGNVIAVTISKELSGSYNSACMAREMVLEDHPEKKIYVINSASAGPALICLIRAIRSEIHSGLHFDAVVEKANKLVANMKTRFALCSFDNLIKNGRMSRVVGFIARSLGFWGIGAASPQGTIVIKGKERSTKKVIASFIEEMRAIGGPKQVIISHCQNMELAERIRDAIHAVWENAMVEICATKGLCGYYAERHGLIISYV